MIITYTPRSYHIRAVVVRRSGACPRHLTSNVNPQVYVAIKYIYRVLSLLFYNFTFTRTPSDRVMFPFKKKKKVFPTVLYSRVRSSDIINIAYVLYYMHVYIKYIYIYLNGPPPLVLQRFPSENMRSCLLRPRRRRVYSMITKKPDDSAPAA